jgi:hemolysin E
MSTVSPTDVVSLIKDGIDTANQALDLYNRAIDQLIPWKTYEETIKEIDRYKDEYSKSASEMVGNVKTLLMDAQDRYYSSTQEIYQWCGLARNLLPIYISALDDPAKLEAQRVIILKVLDEGITKMGSAIVRLEQCSSSFNEAAGGLTRLDAQLGNDFSEKSSYYEQQVDKLRKQAYGGAAAGIALGPFGLIISYSIAAGVLEGKLIPELKKKLKSVEDFFKKTRALVEESTTQITSTKSTLKSEVEKIGGLKTDIETVKTLVPLDTVLKDEVKEATRKLMQSCESYQKSHGSKS